MQYCGRRARPKDYPPLRARVVFAQWTGWKKSYNFFLDISGGGVLEYFLYYTADKEWRESIVCASYQAFPLHPEQALFYVRGGRLA
jgi:hypothetical protein